MSDVKEEPGIDWDKVDPLVATVGLYSPGSRYLRSVERPKKVHDYHDEALRIAYPQLDKCGCAARISYTSHVATVEAALRAAHLRGERREESK